MSTTIGARQRRLRALAVATGLVGLVAVSAGSAAAADPVSGLVRGDSVEGQGVYDSNVNISSPGEAKFVVEGQEPVAYGAADDGKNGIKNGCLGGDGLPGDSDAYGFADASKGLDYTFTFKATVSDFSLRMLDFGDFNESNSTNHKVVMTAYDASGEVASSVLEFDTDGTTNPTSMKMRGDACAAATDNTDPGNHVFDVSGAGIVRVTLKVEQGLDPNIAFTDLDYTIDDECLVQTVDLIAGQTTDAGDVTVYYDAATGKLVVTLTTTGGWVMTETHVDVVKDPELFAKTNKGNPIPGQFEDSKTHDPAVTTYTYEVDWVGPMPAYVAAHAALVQLDSGGPFWASSVEYSSLGYRTAVDNLFRLDPESALGSPNSTFFSLGVSGDFEASSFVYGPYTFGGFYAEGGTLDVAFDGMIWNGPGDDVSVHEVTGGRANYPEEQAEVEAFYDGEWFPLGTASSTAANGVSSFDLGSLPYAEQIRLVDNTNSADFGGRSYDGFDVNAVGASVLVTGQVTGWGEGTQFEGKNWATYITYNPVCAWPEA